MATRINELEDFCQLFAQKLVEGGPSLKRILSAGVMALSECTAEQREYYCARAIGAEKERPESLPHPETLDELRQFLREFSKSPKKKLGDTR